MEPARRGDRGDGVGESTASATPPEYHGMILHLRQGEKMPAGATCWRGWWRCGTKRNELDFRRAAFRVRGDVIDVFPRGACGAFDSNP